MIRNLHRDQKAEIRMETRTDRVRNQRGIRQGNILTLMLFNLYSDKIFKDTLVDVEYGIKVNGVVLNTIRYAEDTLIKYDSLEGLQQLVNRVNRAGQDSGLNIIIRKTKLMVFSRDHYGGAQLTFCNELIERVHSFIKLGSVITDDMNPDIELNCGIETAPTSGR